MSNLEFTCEFNQLESLLYAFALRLISNRDDAKDLLQETALRAFQHRDKFKLGTNFKSWISTIMRNTFINNYRKAKKRKRVSEPLDTFLFALEDRSVVPNEGEINLRMEEYRALFEGLSDLYAVPFLMFFRGYEYKEIAAHLDIPIGTVKSRIFIARRKLKKRIQDKHLAGARS
jgi:RNA polymerase sigma-70 factor (ECF subfamily)